MGFLDKLKRKKDRVVDEVKEQTTNTTTDQNTSPARSEQGSAAGKRIFFELLSRTYFSIAADTQRYVIVAIYFPHWIK
jgi:hypothetical protein